MANKRGPFRYDKPANLENGGLRPVNCEIIHVNKISADSVDVTRWWRPREGSSLWILLPNTSIGWLEFRVASADWTELYYDLDIVNIDHNECVELYPDPGPVTEWFISWYDPSQEPPYDDTALSSIGVSVVQSPTVPGSEAGCFLPYMDFPPPTSTRYVDAVGNEVEYWMEPQGLGHVVAVNDYSVSPPARRLYACTYFEALSEDEDMGAGSDPPTVVDYTWTPVDIDYPKIDRTTGREYDPWGTLLGMRSIEDLATED